jgi:hypothetical protein
MTYENNIIDILIDNFHISIYTNFNFSSKVLLKKTKFAERTEKNMTKSFIYRVQEKKGSATCLYRSNL